jgi:DNA-directed RNA polymerase subunit H (RpoH/RPB5)
MSYLVFYALANYGTDKCYIPQADIQVFLDRISSNKDCRGGIIISPKLASNNANLMLQSSSVTICYHIQHFLTEELLFNPMKHVLVPKHVVLTKEQKEQFFKINKNCKASMMSTFKVKNLHVTSKNKKDRSGDVIAKWLGVEPDDIVMIERENLVGNGMTDRYLFFRRVE